MDAASSTEGASSPEVRKDDDAAMIMSPYVCSSAVSPPDDHINTPQTSTGTTTESIDDGMTDAAVVVLPSTSLAPRNSIRSSSLLDSTELSSKEFSPRRSNTTSHSSGSMLVYQPASRNDSAQSSFTMNQLRFHTFGGGDGGETSDNGNGEQRLQQDMPLHGRKDEIRALQAALDQARTSSHHQQHLVLVSGEAGTGKTALMYHALNRSNKQVIFGAGKFCAAPQGPYAAWGSLVGSLCARLIRMDQQEQVSSGTENDEGTKGILTKIEEASRAALSAEQIGILLNIFPVLEEVFDTTQMGRESKCESEALNCSSNEHYDSNNPTTLDIKYRLQYAFVRFTRIMSKLLAPSCLVLLLDDIHWGDTASMELLEAFLVDASGSTANGSPSQQKRQEDDRGSTGGLLIAATYRSNEVSESFASTLRDWRNRASAEVSDGEKVTNGLSLTDVSLGNLQLDSVHDFLLDLLSTTERAETLALARLCHQRTAGNVFFLMQFLSLVHRDGLLLFNFGTLTWTWNALEMETKTQACENVVDFLLASMKSLPVESKRLLQMAACLGAGFQVSTLVLLWSEQERGHTRKGVDIRSVVDRLLSDLVADGYLVRDETALADWTRSFEYRFTHDKVQEAATRLIADEDQRRVFYGWVGQTLLGTLEPSELEVSLFEVVNLLNEGCSPALEESLDRNGSTREKESIVARMRMAQLNQRASVKAMTLSAYEAAAEYVAVALGFAGVDETFWIKHYDLALDLFSTGAEANSYLGKSEQMRIYCRAVIDRGDVPIEDKLRVYITWLASFANEGAMKQAADETILLLKEFGIHFPRNKAVVGMRTVANILKVKQGLKGDMLDKLVALPVDRDPMRIRLRHLMDRLSVYLYLSQDDLMPLVMFRNFQWTLKYGMNDVAPAALTTLGIIFAGILGDLKGGVRCGEAAVALIPQVSSAVESRTLFVAHGFVLWWTQPLRDQFKPLLRAYEVGLSSGDTESACWSVHLFYHMRFSCSVSLDLILADIEVYMPQMKQLKQIVAYRATLVNYQMFMNLAGRTNTEVTSLIGKYCTEEMHSLWLVEDDSYGRTCRLWECMVRTIYGFHEECAELTIKYGDATVTKSNPGTTLNLYEAFYKGMSSFIAARKTKKKRFQKAAFRIRKRLKDWMAQGNPNVSHYNALFDAEFAALKGRVDQALTGYQLAIKFAARSGLSFDAGLFSECLANYMLDEVGDRNEAVYRFQNAIKYFGDFGARRKISLIHEKHEGLIPKPAEITTTEEMKKDTGAWDITSVDRS